MRSILSLNRREIIVLVMLLKDRVSPCMLTMWFAAVASAF